MPDELLTEFDLAIVGYGGAGAAAAITAADAGARVLVLEKARAGGGSTATSGGNIRLISDVAAAATHFAALTEAVTPRAVVEVYTQRVASLADWLKGLGADLIPHDQYSQQVLTSISPNSAFPHVIGAEGIGSRVQVDRLPGEFAGEALWRVLNNATMARQVSLSFDTPVTALARREQEPGLRVTAIRPDETSLVVEPRAGVVLASGGFGWDSTLLADYLGCSLPSYSPPHLNCGDGIRLAQSVGAGLWHMTATAARFGYQVPGYEAAFMATPVGRGLFVIDQHGRRYFDESRIDTHSAARVAIVRDAIDGRLSRLPSYMVFDEVTCRSGPIAKQFSGYNRNVDWSSDNSREISRGWIKHDINVEGLAAKLNVPADALSRTVERFNSAACGACPDEFGRDSTRMLPINPPYYAIPIWPCLLNTQGGPVRDERCRVLDSYGRPIPGLYSAGELGSMWGHLYPGAANLSEALVTGQIAAESALEDSRVEL